MRFGPAKSKRHNPFVYIALTAALLVSIAQSGCTGLTSANATDPATATTIAVSGANGSFGSVGAGSSATQTFTVTNTGSNPLTINNVAVTGVGYTIAGITLPVTVAAGKSAPIVARFAPATAGALAGNISITANTNPSVTSIALSGNGTTAGQPVIAISPGSLSYGAVAVGQDVGQLTMISNLGSGPLTVSNISVSGIGYSITGVTLPVTVDAGRNLTFIAHLDPTAPGTILGGLTFANNSATSSLVIPMSGFGVSPQSPGQPGLTTSPASISFGNVTIGAPNSQTIVLQNNGTASLTISQATVSGAGFTISGLAIPATIAAGSSTTFNVAFGPNAAGAVSGSVSVVSNAAGSPTAIPLSGTGVTVTRSLSSSTSSLAFGNVAVSSNSTQNVIFTNSANSTVTIGSVSVTGAGFGSSGVVAGQTIGAGQTATLGVSFTPASAATVSGNVTVTSNATNSPISISLSGTGTQAVAHSVALSWIASTSTVVGYNVYRATTSGGPYTLITSSPVNGITFTDTAVQAGVTYFYVVTAVDANGNESVNSNEASATVPTP